jgi:hypothetical protein
MSTSDDARLPCGTSLLGLVAQVADGTPPVDPAHQADCPHCREALDRLRGADRDLRSLAAVDVRAPRGLSARVLDGLRRERGRIVLRAGPEGRDTVTDTIVGQVARRAATDVPGVRFASVTTTEHQDGVHLDLRITADLGPALGPIADAIRELVVDRVARLTGVAVVRIDVVFDDVVA